MQSKARIMSRFSIRFFICLLTFATPFLSYSQSSDWERNVQRKARKIGRDFYFVGLQEIAESLNTHTYYSNKVRKAILYLGEEKITVTAFNPFVMVGQKVWQLPVETKYSDGEIYVPVKFFTPIVKEVLDIRTNGNGVDELSLTTNITGVQIEEKLNGTLIRVNTLKEFDKANVSTRYSQRAFYLDIMNGKINEKSFVKNFKKGLVREIVPVQLEQMATITFKLNKDVSGKGLRVTHHSNELLVSIPKGNVSADLLKKLKDDREKWLIDKIVIDPGHGGRDPGTIGVRGTYEKNVVLGIAKKLKRLIEKRLKVQVFMTRANDTYVSLEKRTQFANEKQAKLFISIHANWNRNGKIKGASTYFLGLAKSDEAIEIAQRENEVIKYDDGDKNSGLSEENIILATMAQNAYNKESQDFADMIQESIAKHTGLRNRGVKQAGFYVMVGASMPNVLIETAFMSNKKEESQLKSSSFQQKMAEGIYESVKEFKQKYELTIQAGK